MDPKVAPGLKVAKLCCTREKCNSSLWALSGGQATKGGQKTISSILAPSRYDQVAAVYPEANTCLSGMVLRQDAFQSHLGNLVKGSRGQVSGLRGGSWLLKLLTVST